MSIKTTWIILACSSLRSYGSSLSHRSLSVQGESIQAQRWEAAVPVFVSS